MYRIFDKSLQKKSSIVLSRFFCNVGEINSKDLFQIINLIGDSPFTSETLRNNLLQVEERIEIAEELNRTNASRSGRCEEEVSCLHNFTFSNAFWLSHTGAHRR